MTHYTGERSRRRKTDRRTAEFNRTYRLVTVTARRRRRAYVLSAGSSYSPTTDARAELFGGEAGLLLLPGNNFLRFNSHQPILVLITW
jgi:hypothetical protein